VTGAAGFIGSHLTESLLEEGAAVVGLDSLTGNYQRDCKLRNLERANDWDEFQFVCADLADVDLVRMLGTCDTVFHLAGEAGVRESWGEPFKAYLHNNVLATQRVMEAIKTQQHSVKLIFASSSSVYGDAEHFPTPETTRPAPVSPYGVTKLAAEHLCQTYGRVEGVGVVILRYFTVYGPRQRPDMAFHRFCRAAVENGPIVIYGDGSQMRDFTFVEDAVAATKAAARAEHSQGHVFNVGGGSQVSLRAAVGLLGELARRPLDVRYEAFARGEARHTGADITRASETFGYRPTVALESGLRSEFEWIAETVGAERAL
jgi:nucleoside-diphosphate-sugar epimerase